MDGIYLEIPEEVLATVGIPRPQLEMELLRRLVAAMYADELVGGSAPWMLAGLEKSELHHWLGENAAVRPLGVNHFALERRNLDEWLTES
jgi:hypothetical protein